LVATVFVKKLINPLSAASTQNNVLFNADGSALIVVAVCIPAKNDLH
jgi:hypothetical protein